MTNQLKALILGKCAQAQILKVGQWDWVYFTGIPEKEIREAMITEGGYFNRKRLCWQFNNGHKSRHSKYPAEYIFKKYGVEEEISLAQ